MQAKRGPATRSYTAWRPSAPFVLQKTGERFESDRSADSIVDMRPGAVAAVGQLGQLSGRARAGLGQGSGSGSLRFGRRGRCRGDPVAAAKRDSR